MNKFNLALTMGLAITVTSAQAVLLTQNADSNTITAGNSVSCNSGGLHTDNYYARAFSFGSPLQVNSVRFGVEEAASISGTQTVFVNLYDGYTTSGSTLTPGALIASEAVSITDGSAFFVTKSVNATAMSGKVVAEIFTPEGQTLGNSFFIGSNAAGQTGASYIKAAACGINNLTTLSSIGFPTMHSIIELDVQAVPEPASFATLAIGAAALLRKKRK